MPWGRKRSEVAPIRAANGTAEKARQVPIDDLQRSTASIVGRWRKSAAPDVLRRTQSPDTTLVDIFQTERNLDQPAEPLTAVLDVLRGSREPVSPR